MIIVKMFMRIILFLLCSAVLATSLFGCSRNLLYPENIISFKIYDLTGMDKEVSSADRNKIIDALNDMKMKKVHKYKKVTGKAINLAVTYPDEDTIYLQFIGKNLFYNIGISESAHYEMNKSMDDILRSIYDETPFDPNNEPRGIKDVVGSDFNSITKVVFSGNYHKTVTSKESIKKVMNVLSGYIIKEATEKPGGEGYTAGKFYAGDKEIFNIVFSYPMNINGKYYKSFHRNLGENAIEAFLYNVTLE